MPKTASSPALSAFLATLGPTVSTWLAELYTFTLNGGEVLRYTTFDRDVSFGGHLWPANTVRWQDPNNRALGHWKAGLDPDTWQVLAMPRTKDLHSGALWPDTVGGQPFLAAAFGGAFSGAAVEVDYAFFNARPALGATSWTPLGTILWFAGEVAEVDVGQSAAAFTFVDYRNRLSTQMPRRLYQSQCPFSVYSPSCGAVKADFAVDGVVGAGSSQGVIVSSIGAPGGSGTYALGQLVMTSGQNAGFSRMIRGWDGARTLSLRAPFYWPLQIGDTFTAYPGCDLTQASCAGFFPADFMLHFGGTPFTPAPETAT